MKLPQNPWAEAQQTPVLFLRTKYGDGSGATKLSISSSSGLGTASFFPFFPLAAFAASSSASSNNRCFSCSVKGGAV